MLPTLLGVTALLATGIVAGYELSSHRHLPGFPDSIPEFPTNVSYQDAFRHHDIHLPSDVSDLEYQARSDLDGYPLRADFILPCTETAAFTQSNHLTEFAREADLPSPEDVYVFAADHEWMPAITGNHWYGRPGGPAATLEVLIDESSTCHVYLTAVDHY